MKLIRDNIPQIMNAEGIKPTTRIATLSEFKQLLKAKLNEEVAEYQKDEMPEELVDILEVIYAIAKTNGLDKDDLENMRREKEEKRGSFSKRIVINQ